MWYESSPGTSLHTTSSVPGAARPSREAATASTKSGAWDAVSAAMAATAVTVPVS